MISDTDSSAKSVKDESNSVHDISKKSKKKSDRDTKGAKKEEEDEHLDRRKKKDKDKEEKKKGKVKDKSGAAGALHFTAGAEPIPVSQEGDFEGDLPTEVFVEVGKHMTLLYTIVSGRKLRRNLPPRSLCRGR